MQKRHRTKIYCGEREGHSAAPGGPGQFALLNPAPSSTAWQSLAISTSTQLQSLWEVACIIMYLAELGVAEVGP